MGELVKVREELPQLLKSKGLNGIGVEVGVARGDFSSHILKNWDGKKLYMVDAWRYFEGVEDINNGNPNEQLDNFAHCFMNTYNYGERAVIFRELSIEAAKFFSNESLDFVYIDASHDYMNMCKDIEAWYPKVKKGGIFAGHDYLDGVVLLSYDDPATIPESRKGHIGVKSAVDQFAKFYNYTVNVTEEPVIPSWWIEL